MNAEKKPKYLGIIGIILFLLIPIPLETLFKDDFLNFDENNLSLNPEMSQVTDYVDDFIPYFGRINGFNYMKEDNDAYAILYEETIGYIYNFLNLDFIFRNVDFDHDIVELHIVLHERSRDTLNVFVGSSPNPTSNVGIINSMMDNIFNVKPFLQSSVLYAKITDSSIGNLGPYLIERMYLLISDLNTPPSVDAGFDQNINEGEVVSFSGSFIDPDESDTHTIKWDFGDGFTATGTLTPIHVYKENGIYIVTLTVNDNHGGVGSDNLIVTVNNVAPIVIATEDQYTQEGTEISLILATFTNPGLFDTHTAIIDWGDGTIEPGNLTEPSGPMMLFSLHQNSIEGEGTVSGTHTYGDNGIYTVVVNVTDDDGGIGSDSLFITVTNIIPVVSAGDDQVVNEGELVSFSGYFQDPGDLDTHTIEWDFGDGFIAIGTLNPTHTYGDNGIYTVILTVTDDDGGISSDDLIVIVNNIAPTAVAGDDQVINEGELVSFNGDFSDPGELDTYTIAWDFGDGFTTTRTLTPTHIYRDNGIYTVILTITDDDGGISSDSLTVIVNNVAPTVVAGDDQVVNEGELVSFNGNFSDPGELDTHTIDWNFGDGFTTTGTLTPTHIYGDNGIYTVTLTIIDNDGGISSDSLTVIVNNLAPAVVAGDDQIVNEGELVSFNGDFSDPGELDTYTIAWNFGDGFTTTGTLTPIHTYGDNGIYLVTLTITDDDGGISSDSLTVIVNNVAPIVVAGDDQIVNEGELVSINGNFSDPGELDTYTIAWDFGDGFTTTGTLTPTHIYGDNGIYTVILTITDDDEGVGSDSLTVIVNNVAPTAAAGDDQVVNEGDLVSFNGDFSDPGELDIYTIDWNFGDGFTTTGTLTPTHTYGDNGIYLVTLTITDDDGGINSNSLTVIVNNVVPTVVAGDDQVVNEGELVSFNGNFYDPGELDTHTIEWNFGDGFTTTGTLTPTHVYGDNGIYTVTLTITDNDGGVGSNILIITVNNIVPSVNISKIKEFLSNVNVSGNAYDPGSDDLTFIWDWGDNSDNTITYYLNDLLIFPVEIEETVEHIYNLPGEFIITLIVMDDDGGIGTDSINVKLMSPRDLKMEALLNLEQLKTGNKCYDKKVDHVIKFIKMSLCEKLWINATHLDPKKGSLVFVFEIIAVRYFEKFLLTESNEYIIENLVRADEMLVTFALEDAKNTNIINPKFQKKYEFCLLNSERHLNEAMIKFGNKEYICAMVHYLISWEYAQLAIKWANRIIPYCKC